MVKKNSRNHERIRRHVRVRNKISGDNKTPRLVVFRSNKNIEAQIIDDQKKVTLVAVNSKSLKLKNGGNIEAAKAVGKAIATKAQEKKISKVVFDRAGYLYHGRVEALATAAREAGLKF
ncbi:MAG: 50S ribosomal protein L18 [Bacilli bacterium]|nr:50S ribosomal protein L18 [Bacilli bacterium]